MADLPCLGWVNMTLATWQSLLMDARDPAALAELWSAALGLEAEALAGGSFRLGSPANRGLLRIDPVGEPKTVKHRVHIDIDVGDLAGLRELGATDIRPPTEEDHWWIMADVEGGEFCAFIRDNHPPLPGRLYEVVVDCAAAARQAEWWADVLGLGSEQEPQEHSAALAGGDRLPLDYLCSVLVPEPKRGPNRVRWDITCADPAALVERGARVLQEPDDHTARLVMADPEGNEFGVLTHV